MHGVTEEITAATIVAASELSNSISIGERPAPRHLVRRSFSVQILGCLIAVTLSASVGCGNSEPVATYPTAAEMERESDANYTVAMLHSLCRDVDLGKTREITPGIRQMTAKVMRAARLHPNDEFDIPSGTTPAESLHVAADTAKCEPELSRRLEVAARDSEGSQRR